MDNVQSWFALKNVPGVGNYLFKRLIDRFGEPPNVFQAEPSELMTVEGVSGRIAGAIKQYRLTDSVKREMALAEQKQCRIYTLLDAEYPSLLRHLPDPPPFIYVLGRLENTENSIAIVGSRSATTYGVSMARRLSADLAAMGLPVVSGMARGIDTAAHQGALAAGGRTIAILGCGLGVVYPPENNVLFNRMVENGAVVSEFPVMEEPNTYNFPARNRIIAGMTIGTVVVEAARQSGSLITARLALEQGREVFAVPGNINSPKSAGTHSLLKQGAKLVTSVQDVVDEFYQLQNRVTSDKNQGAENHSVSGPTAILTEDETRVFDLLEPYPIHMDELNRRAGFDSGKLAGILLTLELKGMIVQSPGKYFIVSGEKH
ncbi:MAG: DNA-protecting protein DprA [Desulfobacteraceae bacterium]|nr:MAG: DNA-protecting protein DprA [Desulfobacteraceae bacterium]